MPRLTNDRPYVAWWRWLLCWLLLHRLCEWRITNETWTFVNQIKSFIMTKYTAMHGVEWSLECRWRGNVARHSGRFCKVAKRLRINSIWWSCWWLKTHGWRQYFVFSSRTRWTGGGGECAPQMSWIPRAARDWLRWLKSPVAAASAEQKPAIKLRRGTLPAAAQES